MITTIVSDHSVSKVQTRLE